MTEIKTANLQWDDHAAPRSGDYGDVYFSVDDGLRESEYVFLQHNQLAERFAALKDSPCSLFTIVETGFGTGLNFSLTVQLWQRCAPKQARLRFISIEKHPLTVNDLRRVYQHWPSLSDIAQSWISHYPPIFPGRHLCRPFQGIELWLSFTSVDEALDELLPSLHPQFRQQSNAVDAWFLDGFAPSKNPDMWRDTLFHRMSELSNAQATFATFTAAGFVKRGLTEAGFNVQKVPGFGRKRDMLCGNWGKPPNEETHIPKGHNALWYLSSAPSAPKRVAIFGAGIAGACLANALATRGLSVDVYERGNAVAQNGSGNAQGVIYGKLSHRDELSARFVTAAMHFAHQYYRTFFNSGRLREGIDGSLCGVAHLVNETPQKLINAFIDSPHFVSFYPKKELASLAGVPLNQSAMVVHEGGWLHPHAFCQAALDHHRITLHLNAKDLALTHTENGWQVGRQHYDAVILATGTQLDSYAAYLPIKPIRGQVTHLPTSKTLAGLSLAVCGQGYVAPAREGEHCIGASFNLGDTSNDIRLEDHQHNVANLQAAIAVDVDPDIAAGLAGRVGFRGTSPDYLPLVGQLVDARGFCDDFAALAKDATLLCPPSQSYIPGLYGLFGLGSKGLTYAPLCAEFLASQLCGELSPLPLNQQMALNPNRFLVRNIIKNKVQNF